MTVGDSGSSGCEVDRHWPPLCRAIGRAEWLMIRGSRMPRARAINAVELIAELDGIFATKPLDEWAEIFAGEPDFFWSPINTHRGRRCRRAVPRRRRDRRRAGWASRRPDGRDAGGFPRHAVGAAVGRATAGRAHRRSSRRAGRTPQVVTARLYKFIQKCHAL